MAEGCLARPWKTKWCAVVDFEKIEKVAEGRCNTWTPSVFSKVLPYLQDLAREEGEMNGNDKLIKLDD